MSYADDLAAWEAERDRLLAEYAAALAVYDQQQAQYLIDKAAYDAAIQAHATYGLDLAASRLRTTETFFTALLGMQSICFTPTWVGPTGYWSALGNWLIGPDPAIPVAVSNPHLWINNRLVAAGLPTDLWQRHIAECNGYSFIWSNPPSAVPTPPDQPIPPIPPTIPDPPVPPAQPVADYRVDPTGYTIVATGVRVNDARVLNRLWGAMKAGEVAELDYGAYARMDVRGVATRPLGGPPITLRGNVNGPRPIIQRNVPPSGGSNAVFFGPGCGDVIFEHLDIEADDTAGVMTANSPMKNFTFRDCRIYGLFDPVAPSGQLDDSKWGALLWKHENWTFEDCEIAGIRQEHAQYGHNRQGQVTWRRVKARHCQRTAFQDVSRPGEGPIGKGDVLLEDVEAVDVCLEQGGGGSAITCRGGNPSSNWTLRRVRVRLGCDAALKAPYNENITGSVVFDNGSGGTYGGTKSVLMDQCDFEVGTVYPGANNAKRSNVRLEVVESVTIRNTRIKGGTNGIALEIATSVPTVRFEGTNSITGKILYHGTPYATLDDLKAAQPGLFA